MPRRARPIPFSLGAGLLFGLGLGGFFDGFMLHQALQWHHMLSSWYPTDTIDNIRLNTFWDGFFHAATYVLVVALVLATAPAWRFLVTEVPLPPDRLLRLRC